MGDHGLSSYSSATQMSRRYPASSNRRGQQPPHEDGSTHHKWSATPAAVGIDSISPPSRSPQRSAPAWSAPVAGVEPSDAAIDIGSPSSRAESRPAPEWSTPAAASVYPSEVALVDLGSRSITAEDMERCFRLWTRLVILIAGRNLVDRLPSNAPETILYLDLSFNR